MIPPRKNIYIKSSPTQDNGSQPLVKKPRREVGKGKIESAGKTQLSIGGGGWPGVGR